MAFDVAQPAHSQPEPAASALAHELPAGRWDETGDVSDPVARLDLPVDPVPAPGPGPLERARPHMGAEALLSDIAGLTVAAMAAAVSETFLPARAAPAAWHGTLLADLGRLVLCVPLLAVVQGVSRGRRLLRTSLAQQVHAAALPMAAGGTLCLVLWRVAQLGGAVHELPVDAVLLLCVFATVTVPVARCMHHLPPRRGGRRQRRVLIVGSGVVAGRIAGALAHDPSTNVVGFVDDDPVDTTGWLGTLADLADVVDNAGADNVMVAFSRSASEDIVEALRPLQGRVPITVVPRLFDVVPAHASVHDIGFGLTGISVAPATFGWLPALVKRTVDVMGAALGVALLSPILVVVAVAVKVTSRGPVLFRQTRIGRDGREFAMLKFRSMRLKVDDDPVTPEGETVIGPFPKLKDDPRVTAVGRVIRRLSVDELPQLLNVLVGQMSLVGPRPFVPDESVWIEGWAQRRYAVRPGITGLWQVSGRNDLTFDDMCRLDQLYVSHWSVGLDTRILVRTLGAVARRHGAY